MLVLGQLLEELVAQKGFFRTVVEFLVSCAARAKGREVAFDDEKLLESFAVIYRSRSVCF